MILTDRNMSEFYQIACKKYNSSISVCVGVITQLFPNFFNNVPRTAVQDQDLICHYTHFF